MNVTTKVLGYDKNGNDVSSLEDKLVRTGHMWSFEETVNYWASVATSTDILGYVTYDNMLFIAKELDRRIFTWGDVENYSRVGVLKLVRDVLIRKGYKVA